MVKYIVAIEKELSEGVFEMDLVEICDREEKATRAAEEIYYENFSDEDRKEKEVFVGEISEECLEEPGDWESFTQLDEVVRFMYEEE